MTVYEENFARLTSLVPALEGFGKEIDFSFLEGVTVDVLERHKYTTVIKLVQDLSLISIHSPVMTVRVCHDARVAEVLSYQGYFRFKPKYDYPNPKMCQVREKRRVNDFLGEWLDFCLSVKRNASISLPL